MARATRLAYPSHTWDLPVAKYGAQVQILMQKYPDSTPVMQNTSNIDVFLIKNVFLVKKMARATRLAYPSHTWDLPMAQNSPKVQISMQKYPVSTPVMQSTSNIDLFLLKTYLWLRKWHVPHVWHIPVIHGIFPWRNTVRRCRFQCENT